MFPLDKKQGPSEYETEQFEAARRGQVDIYIFETSTYASQSEELLAPTASEEPIKLKEEKSQQQYQQTS